jgi:LCP family protein required for cell wall assembly
VAPTGRVTFLILGIDHRPGGPDEYGPQVAGLPEDPGRSDTIAVMHLDPVAKSAAILGIPRDLWVQVPDGQGDWTTHRINEAYHTGEMYQLPGGGPTAAAAAITHNFGIPIDHILALDFNGFMALIDAVGGLDVDVPQPLRDATVLPRSDDGGYAYSFRAGKQHLNGELALAYARFRNDPQGDFGRIQRQQQLGRAAWERAVSLGWATRSRSLWQQYHAAVQTDLGVADVAGYALVAAQIGTDQMRMRSLGEPGATTEVLLVESGMDVLLPAPEALARIVEETFGEADWGTATRAALQRLYPSPPRTLGRDPATGLPLVHTPQNYIGASSRR